MPATAIGVSTYGDTSNRVAAGPEIVAATASADRKRMRVPVHAYCLTYGWPSAFGGTDRPITPATAISVNT
jgi:hypothetical protein